MSTAAPAATEAAQAAPAPAPAPRTAHTSEPIHPVLAERWSPRSFDQHAIVTDAQVTAALEAARWSPSASNSQPWRFIVARRGTPEFDTIVAHLVGFNAAWAGSAALLVVNIAELEGADGSARPWARYDLGGAVAHFTIQAHHDGLHVHQIGGFDATGLGVALRLPDRFAPMSISAVGVVGPADALAEPARQREIAPRTRLPLTDLLTVG
ncbi:nitroreductase family protein [Marisediminicola senii]|uniref:nitroreductase family protein n=1 Tax=Marisediminicola senii TaxID=2711233 RepID=UPI0013ED4095|nr:nitroreductase family protein [Marisediminicola senii]